MDEWIDRWIDRKMNGWSVHEFMSTDRWLNDGSPMNPSNSDRQTDR